MTEGRFAVDSDISDLEMLFMELPIREMKVLTIDMIEFPFGDTQKLSFIVYVLSTKCLFLLFFTGS